MPDEHGRRLDNAIDRAVRGMMQIDPVPGLRQRVADRLRAPARRGSWLMPAMATAALLALVVATIWLRSSEMQPILTPRVAEGPAPAPVSPGDAPRADTAAREPRPSPDVARTAAPSETIFGPRRDRVTAASLTAHSREGDSVGTLDPYPIADEWPSLPPIAIEPIVIRPITISPIFVSVLPERK